MADGRWSQQDARARALVRDEIRTRAAAISRANPVRAIAERLLAGAHCLPGEFSVLVSACGSPSNGRWRERIVSTWALGDEPWEEGLRAHAVAVLSETLSTALWRDDLGRVFRWVRRGLLLAGALAAVAALVAGVVAAGDGSRPSALLSDMGSAAGIGIGIAILLSPVTFGASVYLEDHRANLIRTTAAHALGRIGAPEGVDALAEAACSSSGGSGYARVRLAAQAALKRVLPALSDDHFGRLAAETVPCLCRLLRSPDQELALVVATALGHVGDRRAIEPVERLCRGQAMDALRAEADRVLPLIRERVRRAREAATLLRPSGAGSEELLVRPAGPGDGGLEALVRPATEGDAP